MSPKKNSITQDHLQAENEALRSKVAELEQTLQVLREGAVDAIAIPHPQGSQIFTLQGADQVYRVLIEEMSDGALTLSMDGMVLYCNQRFAEMLGIPLSRIIGSKIAGWLPPDEREKFEALLRQAGENSQRAEITLPGVDGSSLVASVFADSLSLGGMQVIYLVVADLTEYKNREVMLQSALEEARQARLSLLDLFEEQKSTERKLRESEFELQRFLNNSPDTVYVLDLVEHTSRFLNREEYLGYSRAELESDHSIMGAVHPDDLAFLSEQWKQLSYLRPNQVLNTQYRVKNKSGDWEWVQQRNTVLTYSEDGKPQKVLNTLSIVTEKKQMEDALRENEAKFAAAFHTSPVALVISRRSDGVFLEFNEELERISGYTRAELQGQSVNSLGLLADPELRQRLVSQDLPRNLEIQMRHKSGEWHWLTFSMSPIQIQGQDCYLSVIQDIHSRKLIEQSLRESEEKFAAAFHNSPVGIVVTDAEGRLMEVNQAFCDLHRYKRDESIGKTVVQLGAITDEINQSIGALLVASGSGLAPREIDIRDSEGKLHNVLYSIVPIKINGIPHTVGMTLDMTDRKQAEKQKEKALEELELERSLLRQLIDNLPDLIFLKDRESRFLVANRATASFMGVDSPEQLVGRTDFDFYPESLAQQFRAAERQVMESGEGINGFERTQLDIHQNEHWLAATKLALHDTHGQIIGLVGIERDITLRRRAEDALRESEERFRKLIDFSPVAIITFDEDGNFELVNRKAVEFFGASSEQDLIGKPVLERVHPNFHVLTKQRIAQANETDGPVPFVETAFLRLDGTSFDVLSGGVPLKFQGKHSYVVSFLDITDRRLAEQALRESENKFAVAFHTSPMALAITRRSDGVFLDFNAELEQICGYTRAELQGQSVNSLGLLPGPELRQKLAEQGSVRNFEIQMQHKSDERRWLNFNISPIRLQGQDCLLSVIQDIHERKHDEEELRIRTLDLQIINAVNEAANRGGGLQGMAEAFAEAAQTAFDCRSVAIHLLSKDGSHLELQGTTLPKQLIAQVEKWLGTSINTHIRIPLEKSAYIRRLLENQQGVILNEAGEIHEWLSQFVETNSLPEILRAPARKLIPQIAKLINIQSVLILPLVSGGKALGLLVINSKNVFTQTHMERMDFIGKQVTAAILRQQTEDILHESEEKYRSLIESLDNVVATVDQEGSFLYMNQVAANQLGQPVEALVGKTIHDLFPPAVADSQLEHIRQAIREDMVQTYETLSNIGGELRWFRTVIQPIHDANGKVTHALINSTDIHELKTLYQELQELNHTLEERVQERTAEIMQVNAELEHAMRIKDEFLASMSHELRTPLNGILGFSESLEMNVYGSLNEKQTKVIKLIGESGQHLLELINDILDLAKVETGNLELDLSYVSVADVCLASLQLTKGMSGKKHQSVQYTPLVEPILLYGDARRLKQVLVNLLSNAIKFTPEKGELGLEVHANPQDQQIQFVVWDKGIGIKPEYLSRLFKPFTQIDSRLSREYSGTGLGLSLVQKLVELHDGSVEVASVFGEGSRFTVTLPWQPLESDQTEQETSSSKTNFVEDPPVPLKMPLVAIADDNDLMLQLITDFLEPRNFRVAAMNNGKVLLEKISYLRPDIVLMDIQMPGMDGLEAIRRVRAHSDPRIASIPIIAITALAMPGDKERCFEAGANEFVSKPFNLINLIGVLQQLLDRGK